MDDLVEMETHHLGSLLNSLHTSTVFILRISVRKSCKVVFPPDIWNVKGETGVTSLAMFSVFRMCKFVLWTVV